MSNTRLNPRVSLCDNGRALASMRLPPCSKALRIPELKIQSFLLYLQQRKNLNMRCSGTSKPVFEPRGRLEPRGRSNANRIPSELRKFSCSIDIFLCGQLRCAGGFELHATVTASVCMDEFTLNISGYG